MRNCLCTFMLIYFCHYSYADEYVSTRLTEFEKGEWIVTAWSNISDEDTIISTNIEFPAIKASYVKDRNLKQIDPALQIRCALKYDSNKESQNSKTPTNLSTVKQPLCIALDPISMIFTPPA